MLTEDYLMRMINLAVAALLKAIGLKKAGKHQDARQAIDQAVEALTSMPANLVDQMDDDSVLSMLTVQEQLDAGRLAVLADLFWEQGEIQQEQGQADQGNASRGRSLRFTLEAALAGEGDLSQENLVKIEARRRVLVAESLPVETQLALLDYLQRLSGKDEAALADADIQRGQVAVEIAAYQARLGPFMNPENE
jgi:hypothetical protein